MRALAHEAPRISLRASGRRRLRVAALALLCLAGPAAAADFSRQAVGTTGSEFLLFDQGARGIALGGAYTAVTDDANSLYWNPAGLSRVPRFSAALMYSRYVADVVYHSGSFARRVSDESVLAAGWRFRDIGDIEHTDLSGARLGSFHPRDYVVEAGWGQSILDMSDSEVDISMGIAGRMIHSDYLEHGTGYGGDIGIQSRFYTGPYAYDVGFVAQNLGQGQKFDKTRDTLPFRARLGGAVYPSRSFMISAEAVMPSNNVVHGAAGMEYTLAIDRNIKAAVRGGFNTLTLQSLGGASSASGGMGLKVGDLSFDYAFVPFGVLGEAVHRLSISYNLPAKVSSRRRAR